MRRNFITELVAMSILVVFVLQTNAQLFREDSIVMCPYQELDKNKKIIRDTILVAIGEGKGKNNYKVYDFVKGYPRINGSPTVYRGNSPITAMIPFRGGVLTALTNADNKTLVSKIHWSKDGRNLGNPAYSPVLYEGNSPITAMLPFKKDNVEGVIIALYNVDNIPGRNEIFWYSNPDPTKPGSLQPKGKLLDEGNSEVTAMIAYKDGIYVAFKNVENNPNVHRVHWCPSFDEKNFDKNAKDGNGNAKTIGNCEYRDYYGGLSPVTAMLSYKNGTTEGVLTALTNNGNNPNDNVVYLSKNGMHLGATANDIMYPIAPPAISPVRAIAHRGEGLLTAFTNWQGENRIAIQLTNGKEALSAGANVYEYPRRQTRNIGKSKAKS